MLLNKGGLPSFVVKRKTNQKVSRNAISLFREEETQDRFRYRES